MSDSIQTAKQLLEQVAESVKKIKEDNLKTGRTYNVFKIAGIREKEVIMCRVLADFLNPKGHHRRGSVYLKLFMDMVLEPAIKKAVKLDLSRAKVVTEYTIEGNRRIDIVIDDGVVFIPIEVKIYAGQQQNQIADYADYSRKMNNGVDFIPVLFLTPGWYKSDEAAKGDYVQITFEKHIISWLEKCLSLEETDKVLPVKEVLKQFIRAIKSFCGIAEDEIMENAINALITESKDTLAAAILIGKSASDDVLHFQDKIWEIFKDQIINLVKKSFPEAELIDEGEGAEKWNGIDIPIGHGCNLRLNYDLKSIAVQSVNSEKIDNGTADKIKKTMSGKNGTGSENSEDKSFIWISGNLKYPCLKDIDDELIYKFELLQIYSKKPQSVADWIVSMANELKNL